MIRQQQILTNAAAITLLTIGGPAAASDDGKSLRASRASEACATQVRLVLSKSQQAQLRIVLFMVIGLWLGAIGIGFAADRYLF